MRLTPEDRYTIRRYVTNSSTPGSLSEFNLASGTDLGMLKFFLDYFGKLVDPAYPVDKLVSAKVIGYALDW